MHCIDCLMLSGCLTDDMDADIALAAPALGVGDVHVFAE